MIAIALSGGVDSAAAAVLLRRDTGDLIGLTLVFDESNPSRSSIEQARALCGSLKIRHVLVDAGERFESVRRYFCQEYLSGGTPNPCVVCNRDVKFGFFLEEATRLGAGSMATGHYVRKGQGGGRVWLGRARERNSQEYFLGLLPQDAIRRSLFPLQELTRQDARELAAGAVPGLSERESSQDVCFVGGEGYVSFITSRTGCQPGPGDIVSPRGHVIGRHRGALFYTIGQRKGLGMGFGRRVYVLDRDMEKNTVTVGDLKQWPYRGFLMEQVNWMKLSGLRTPLTVRMKVRYRQDAKDALLVPAPGGRVAVRYQGLFSPGQLAAAYDDRDDVLCAGVIVSALTNLPEPGTPVHAGKGQSE